MNVQCTIWKFPLQVTDVQDVMIPWCDRFLSVQEQNGQLVLWAMVNPTFSVLSTRVRIVGTGHDASDVITSGLTYVGTVQMKDDALVWHVFIDSEAHARESR